MNDREKKSMFVYESDRQKVVMKSWWAKDAEGSARDREGRQAVAEEGESGSGKPDKLKDCVLASRGGGKWRKEACDQAHSFLCQCAGKAGNKVANRIGKASSPDGNAQ